MERDHPRMRGEHDGVLAGEGADFGIIPACAGSTTFAWGTARRMPGSSPHARGAPVPVASRGRGPRDHPRMRGEHVALKLYAILTNGIIPACAGSTSKDGMQSGCVWGSSPHARGARRRAPCQHDGRHGSSPHARRARAPTSTCSRPRRDHPRMRGEHKLRSRLNDCWHGIIPACAGSTPAIRPGSCEMKGSSPHARGAPARNRRHSEPARDHPRMRGEHRGREGESRRQGGIIPACAGSTLEQPSCWHGR